MMACVESGSSVINSSLEICQITGVLRMHIETPRLIIRPFQEQDFLHSVKLYGDPEITQLFDSGKPKTSLQVRELMNAQGTYYFNNGAPWGIFSVFLKETGQFIGHIDLLPSDLYPNWLEIGYILSKTAWGQGLGTEMAQSLILHYIPLLVKKRNFGGMSSIQGVMATAHPENISSQKVVLKLGMKYQGSYVRFSQPRDIYALSFYKSSLWGDVFGDSRIFKYAHNEIRALANKTKAKAPVNFPLLNRSKVTNGLNPPMRPSTMLKLMATQVNRTAVGNRLESRYGISAERQVSRIVINM